MKVGEGGVKVRRSVTWIPGALPGALASYRCDPSEETINLGSRDEWLAEKNTRNYRIWYARKRGNCFTDIARKVGLSATTVRNIYIQEEQRRKRFRISAKIERQVQELQKVTKDEEQLATGLFVLLEAFGGVKAQLPSYADRNVAMYGAVAHA